jgi:hypothetical protein
VGRYRATGATQLCRVAPARAAANVYERGVQRLPARGAPALGPELRSLETEPRAARVMRPDKTHDALMHGG